MMRFRLVEQKAHNIVEAFLDGHLAHWMLTIPILMNSFLLGLETSEYYMRLCGDRMEKIIDILLWIFMAEIALRIFAGGVRFFTKLLDILDFAAVFSAIYFSMPELSAFRLIRVMRVFLLYEISPRMQHILHGVRHAIPSVINVIGLIVILFYVSSVIGVALFKHPNIPYFQSMGVAMKALFQTLSGDDWYNILRHVEAEFPWAWVYFFTFYVCMVFVILNLFIGVIVGALQSVAEEFDKKFGKLEDNPVLDQLTKLQEEIRELRESMKKKK